MQHSLALSQGDFNTPSKVKAKGRPSKNPVAIGGPEDDEDSDGAGIRMGGQAGEGAYGDSEDDVVLPPKKAKAPFGMGLGMGGLPSSSLGILQGHEGLDDEDDDDDDDGSMGDEDDDDSNPSMARHGGSYILGAKGWGERPSSQGAVPAQQVLPTQDGGEMEL